MSCNHTKCKFDISREFIFAEPNVTIIFKPDPITTEYEPDFIFEVLCRIDFAQGRPKFKIWYNGTLPYQYNLVASSDNTSEKGYYIHGQQESYMRLPRSGKITCEVTDDIGTYAKTQTIVSNGEFVASAGSSKWKWLNQKCVEFDVHLEQDVIHLQHNLNHI